MKSRSQAESFYFPGGSQGVVLFHSFTSSSADVGRIGRALNKPGYTVYFPLLKGHGGPVEAALLEDPEDWFRQGCQVVGT